MNSNVSYLENEEEIEEREEIRGIPTPTTLVRMAMRVSRSRCFTFLRRVFHYQNGSSSNLGSNPFNSYHFMLLEFLALFLQISMSLFTLCVSMDEKPVWPMRVWILGYDFGCLITLFILFLRYKHSNFTQGRDNNNNIIDLEQQISNDHHYSRSMNVVNKCKASLDLFYAMWFVMGNVWIFDSRFGSFNRAPKLHILCITILAWNGLTYSFPFLLFVLLCIFVPLVSSSIGYNMSLGSAHKGASHHQIQKLLCWRFKQLDDHSKSSSPALQNPECCICLAKYKEREEIRQLPCCHIFHRKCVDQWLTIISCCPLCKQGLDF